MSRGNRDRSSLHFAVGGDKLLEGSEGAATELAPDGIGARDVAVDDTQEPHGLALLLKLFVDAGMVAAKGPYADHGYVNGMGTQNQSLQV